MPFLSFVFAKALEIASNGAPEPLDNLHLATPNIVLMTLGLEISYFVTQDHETLKRCGEIRRIAEISIASPLRGCRIGGFKG